MFKKFVTCLNIAPPPPPPNKEKTLLIYLIVFVRRGKREDPCNQKLPTIPSLFLPHTQSQKWSVHFVKYFVQHLDKCVLPFIIN